MFFNGCQMLRGYKKYKLRTDWESESINRNDTVNVMLAEL